MSRIVAVIAIVTPLLLNHSAAFPAATERQSFRDRSGAFLLTEVADHSTDLDASKLKTIADLACALDGDTDAPLKIGSVLNITEHIKKHYYLPKSAENAAQQTRQLDILGNDCALKDHRRILFHRKTQLLPLPLKGYYVLLFEDGTLPKRAVVTAEQGRRPIFMPGKLNDVVDGVTIADDLKLQIDKWDGVLRETLIKDPPRGASSRPAGGDAR
jgi:hypothetical protein